MAGDDSDDDIGTPANFNDNNLGLDYNSDENEDDEQLASGTGNELIDLGSSGPGKAATNIPKLSGPN